MVTLKTFQSRKRHLFSIRIASVIISICILLTGFYLKITLKQERNVMEHQVELVQLGYKLANASDNLTSSVREYVISLDPKFLKEYWHEINIRQTRKNVIRRLIELQATPQELALLKKAKYNSDALVETEARGMKLILTAMEVPEAVIPQDIRAYQLSRKDKLLSAKDQVNLARTIMFDKAYDQNKKNIMQPIENFQKTLSQRIQQASKQATTKTTLGIFLLFTLATIQIALFIAWLLVVYSKPKEAKHKSQSSPTKSSNS